MGKIKSMIKKTFAAAGLTAVLAGTPYGIYKMHESFQGWKPEISSIMQDPKLSSLSGAEKNTIEDLTSVIWRDYISEYPDLRKKWGEEETRVAALLIDALDVHSLEYKHVFAKKPNIIPEATLRLIREKGDYSINDLGLFLNMHDSLSPFVDKPISSIETERYPEQVVDSIHALMKSGHNPNDLFVACYELGSLVERQMTFKNITAPVSEEFRKIPVVLFYDNSVSFNHYLRHLAKVPILSIDGFTDEEAKEYLNPENLATAAGVLVAAVREARQKYNFLELFDKDRIHSLYTILHDAGYSKENDSDGKLMEKLIDASSGDFHRELYSELMKNLFQPNNYLQERFDLDSKEPLSPDHALFSDEDELKKVYFLSVADFFSVKQLQMLNVILQTADRHDKNPVQYASLANLFFMNYLEDGITLGMAEENIRKMKAIYVSQGLGYDLEKLIGNAVSFPRKQFESYERDNLQNLFILQNMPGIAPFLQAIEKDDYLKEIVEDIKSRDSIFRPFETADAAYNELKVQASRIGVNFIKNPEAAEILTDYSVKIFSALLDVPTTFDLEQLKSEALRRNALMEEVFSATQDILNHTYQRYHNAAILATTIYEINQDYLSLSQKELESLSEYEKKRLQSFSLENTIEFMKHYSRIIEPAPSLAYTTESVKKIIISAKNNGHTLEDAKNTLDAIVEAGSKEYVMNSNYLNPEKLANAVSYALMHLNDKEVGKFTHNIKSLSAALKRQGIYLEKMKEDIDPNMYVYGAVTLSRSPMSTREAKVRLNSYVDRWFQLLRDAVERPWLYMNNELTDFLNAEKLVKDSKKPTPENPYLGKDPLVDLFRGFISHYEGAEHLHRLFEDHPNIVMENLRIYKSQTEGLSTEDRALILRTIESLKINNHEFDNLHIPDVHRKERTYDNARMQAEFYATNLFNAATVIGSNPVISVDSSNVKRALNLLRYLNEECNPAGEDSRLLYAKVLSDLVLKSEEHGVTIPQLKNIISEIIDIPEEDTVVILPDGTRLKPNYERYMPPDTFSYRKIEKISNAVTQLFNNAVPNQFTYDDLVHVVGIATEISYLTCAFEDPNSFLVSSQKYLREVKKSLGKDNPLTDFEAQRAIQLVYDEYDPHIHMVSPEKLVQDVISTLKDPEFDWSYLRVQ